MLHRHHIVPRHAGGTDDPSNIALLTVAAHAEAHRLLFVKFGRWQDEVAWKGLAGIIGKEEAVRRSQQSMLGKKHSDETKQKMSEARKKWKHSPETKVKMGMSRRGKRNPMFGKEFSEEYRQKLSDARRGIEFSDEWKSNISAAKKGKVWVFDPVLGKSQLIDKESAENFVLAGFRRGRK